MEKTEFEIIASFFKPIAASYSGSLGLGDDAGIMLPSVPKNLQVATMDSIVEGVHFLKDDPPELVAKKLVRVNISDLAAMGAVPKQVLLSTAWSKDTSIDWIAGFAKGLQADIEEFGLVLIGGDTVSAKEKFFSFTAIGEVEENKILKRSDAKPDDLILVSGTIGDSALGLAVILEKISGLSLEDKDFLESRYRLPQPRCELGQRLAGFANACMDISDGLCADLFHICEQSEVGAEIFESKIPLSKSAKSALGKGGDFKKHILAGGDDYELLFTASEAKFDKIMQIAQSINLPVTVVGRILKQKPQVKVISADGSSYDMSKKGYDHFA